MSRFFQYCTLTVQGCLVALFLGTALYGQIHVAFEIQRNVFKSSEEKRPWPLAIPHAFLLIFVDEMAFAIFPYFFRIVGIKSEKAILIFPIVHLVASIVAWYTAYLPVFIATPVHDILYSILLIMNERGRKSTPNPPSVATGERKSLPRTQVPRDYHYKRLTQQRSIRILTLAPSRLFEAPLECRLFEVPLDNAPRYTALSYAWDASEGTTSIVCNGSFPKVTWNCARALHRIRQMQGSNSINLWVDAICIDQGNTLEALSERTQQIQIMGEIYERASRVTAWVGEHEHDSRYICEFLESVGRVFDGELDDASTWTKAEGLALEKARQWIKFVDRLREFFHRSWFTRMWPIQEVTLPLPGRVSLLCGDSSIPFEYIRAGWQVLPEIGLLASSVNLDQSVALQFYLADALALKRNYSSTTNIRRLGRPLITDLSQLSLPNIMRATRFKACSLAKDKFFALHGVFKELEVPHKVDVTRYTEMTEVEVFMAVFESCIAFDSSLDVLRLAQSPEGYVGHDDFWAKRQDPYDSFANAVFGTVAKISPMLFRGVVDNAPKWRASLPSWVPDWTQWTHGGMDDRDIALVRSYSTRALWDRSRWSATTCTKLGSPIHNDLHDTGLAASILYRPLSRADGARQSRVPQSINDCPRIRVQAKVVGVVRSVGSVDSVGLLWQLISALFNFYGWQRHWVAHRTGSPKPLPKDLFLQPVPDAFVAATIETVRNFVVNSNVAQIVLSLRMVYQAFGVMAFFRCFNAIYETWCLQPVLKRVVCSMCPSAAACLESGLEFGEPSWITIGIFTVLSVLDPGDDPSSRFVPFYHRFRRQISTFIVCGAWLVWQLRVSLYNTLYSDPYETLPSWFTEPFSIYLVAHGVIPVATFFEDEVLILLGRATMAIGGLHAAVSVLLLSPLRYLAIVTLITTGIHACRCIRGTVAEILGSEMFTRRASFTSGLNFFTTESGLTGRTSGPVQFFDVVVIVDRASDPMVMRRCGKEFEVVGAAYVGNKSRKELEESSASWNPIHIL